jgi:catechol 2,3-dioxygenase-like lactoylglutathione lyase family enzyme
MKIEFVASVATITSDPAASRALYVDALRLPLGHANGDDYLHSEAIEGCKHFYAGDLSLGHAGRAQCCGDLWAGRSGVPAVRQRRRGAFGGRARGDGPRSARAVRAGVPGTAAGISAAAGVWPAATAVVGLSLVVAVVGIPFGSAVA